MPSRHAAVILALAFANMALASGITLGFAVFYGAILEAFGGSRSATVGIFSVIMLAQGAAAIPIGAVHDRLGARVQTVGGAALLGLGLLLSAAITAPWQLYLTYGLLAGVGATGLTWVGQAPILAAWFRRRLATVNSLAYAGMGIGTIALAPLTQWLILHLGWRPAFLALGGAVLALAVPANWRLQRPPRPDEREDAEPRPVDATGPAAGAAAGGARDPAAAAGTTPASEETAGAPGRSLDLRGALGTLDFWGLGAEFFGIAFGVFMIAAHQVVYAADAGFDRLVAAWAFGLVGLMSGVGRIAFGVAADLVGKQTALAVSFACSIGGIVLLLAAGATGAVWLLTAYAIVFGLGFGARGPILAAEAAARFPGPRFGTIFGAITLFHGLGSAAGPYVGGLLYDLASDYRLPFVAAIISLAAAWALGARLARRPLHADGPAAQGAQRPGERSARGA